MRNPEADVVDAIAALVDEQLEQERSGYDHNINQDTCPQCGGPWHGLVRGTCPGATGIRGSESEPAAVSALAQITLPVEPWQWQQQRYSQPTVADDNEPLHSEFRLVIPQETHPRFEFHEPGDDPPALDFRYRVIDLRCMSAYYPMTDFVALEIRVEDQTLSHTYPAELIHRVVPGYRLAHTALPPHLPDSYVELYTHPNYGAVAMFRIKGGALQFRLRFAGLSRP